MPQYVEPDPRKWTIHRNRRGWPRWYQRWLEAWWIITGKWSLHRAWQDGKDLGGRMEYERLITNRAAITDLQGPSRLVYDKAKRTIMRGAVPLNIGIEDTPLA